MESEEKELTQVAVLGTLAEFHREPIPYDMSAVVEAVIETGPDLLCLDMTPRQWENQDFSNLPPEYREALLPLAHQTDIVVVPIGDGLSMPDSISGGWRGRTVQWLRRWIRNVQRKAPGPDAINQGWRHELINYLYHAMRWLSSGEVENVTQEHTEQLIQAIHDVVRRDPGTRILVVVNVQFCHIVRERLRVYDDVEVTPYTSL